MDPRNRADDTLAHARARGAFVVTPDSATSPMDASSTVRIPRALIDDADHDREPTVVLPHSSPQEPLPQAGPAHVEPTSTEPANNVWPSEDHDRHQHGRGSHVGTGNCPGSPSSPEHGHPHDPPPQYGQLHYGQLQHGRLEQPQTQYTQAPGHGSMPPNPYGPQGTPREPASPGAPTDRQNPASPG